MRFTKQQYEEAIRNLMVAQEQLEPDGKCCSCCGDSGHQAFECGSNPLVAMAICREIAVGAQNLHEELHNNREPDPKGKLHEILHYLGGFDRRMGEPIGPTIVRIYANG